MSSAYSQIQEQHAHVWQLPPLHLGHQAFLWVSQGIGHSVFSNHCDVRLPTTTSTKAAPVKTSTNNHITYGHQPQQKPRHSSCSELIYNLPVTTSIVSVHYLGITSRHIYVSTNTSITASISQ